LVMALAACGSGTVADTVRPDTPTASSAMGEEPMACGGVAAYGQPLVVDWKANQRLDLELAMKEGVVVVAYDCGGFRLLPDCRVEGDYSFAGVSRKEDTVQLKSRDEIHANLPMSAASLVADLERGATIDVAMVMVGKRSTTVHEVERAQLEGRCEGATHTVRGAYLGAFALAKGSDGKVRAAAELFNAGTDASSESTAQIANKDGLLTACDKAEASAEAPPDQCQSLIRLELTPVAAAQTKAKEGDAPGDPCAEGLVFSEGKCTKDRSLAFACAKDDFEQCRAQCERGSAESCTSLAYLHLAGRNGAPKDVDRATELFEKSCEGGDAKGCHRFGMALMRKRIATSDLGGQAKLFKRAEAVFLESCELGDGWSCWNTSSWYLRPMSGSPFQRNDPLAVSLLERSCDLGYPAGCSSLAAAKMSGEHTKKDVVAALSLYKRGCDGGHFDDCEDIGDIYAQGVGVAKDPMSAVDYYHKACDANGLRACAKGARLLLDSELKRAVTLARLGCPEKGPTGWDACELLGELLEQGRGVKKNLAKAAEAYVKGGLTLHAGEIYESGKAGAPDLDKAFEAYERGCNKFSRDENRMRNCDHTIRLLDARNPADAKAFAADLCARMRYEPACQRAKR